MAGGREGDAGTAAKRCYVVAREQCAIFDLALDWLSLSFSLSLSLPLSLSRAAPSLPLSFSCLGQRNVPASALNRIKKSHVRRQLRLYSPLPPPLLLPSALYSFALNCL